MCFGGGGSSYDPNQDVHPDTTPLGLTGRDVRHGFAGPGNTPITTYKDPSDIGTPLEDLSGRQGVSNPGINTGVLR